MYVSYVKCPVSNAWCKVPGGSYVKCPVGVMSNARWELCQMPGGSYVKCPVGVAANNMVAFYLWFIDVCEMPYVRLMCQMPPAVNCPRLCNKCPSVCPYDSPLSSARYSKRKIAAFVLSMPLVPTLLVVMATNLVYDGHALSWPAGATPSKQGAHTDTSCCTRTGFQPRLLLVLLPVFVHRAQHRHQTKTLVALEFIVLALGRQDGRCHNAIALRVLKVSLLPNAQNVKWPKCQMAKMSNGQNVKWPKCQMPKLSNALSVKLDAPRFCRSSRRCSYRQGLPSG
jgi:hypothetical protein